MDLICPFIEQSNRLYDFESSSNIYVAYIPLNVCNTCLLSMYTGFKEIGVNTKNVLLVHYNEDIQFKREAASFGYDNLICDKVSAFETINTLDIVIFKYNIISKDIKWIRYDDFSQSILYLLAK